MSDNATTPAIHAVHATEWIEGSAVSQNLTNFILHSIDDKDAIARLLNWKKYFAAPGWFVRSVEPETGMYRDSGQFKPNEPIVFPDDDKAQKYVSFPKGKGSELVFPAVDLPTWFAIAEHHNTPLLPTDIDESRDDNGFWLWVINHPELPLVPTEGIKKGACLLSHGYIPLVLPGVWNGQREKKLHPDLVPFVVPERLLVVAFDSDILVKGNVQDALKMFCRLATKAGAVTAIAQWEPELGKGIDDVVVQKGVEMLHHIMSDTTPYSDWLKGLEAQFKDSEDDTGQRRKKQKDKIPPADVIALSVAEQYRDQLAYNNESGFWLRYEADAPGVWSVETLEYIEAIVHGIVAGRGIVGYNSHSYITNIVKTLRCVLIQRKWNEHQPNELLPFQNGVLELATGKLLPHAPGFRFTWQLPRQYNLLASDWSKIDAFLTHATNGNDKLKEILLCFCNAVLKGRSDLQKFLHLIGTGGSGKGTFTRLLADIIGTDNVHSSTLEDWCDNRFESANAYRKRLVAFPDEDKRSGKLGKFKSLMGGDLLRGEEKGKKAFQFRYDGMVIVSSNYPIFAGDTSSGMSRRVITVPFTAAVASGQRRDLNKEFQPELAAFTNYVLSIPNERVTAVLLGLDEVPESAQEFWEARIRTDSIAAWVNDWVIYDPMATTAIGSDRNEYLKGDVVTLYGSYAQYCNQMGLQSKANKNFSPDLLELCNSILGWQIEKVSTKTGKYIRGLRLRTPSDGNIPTYDYTLEEAVKNQFVTGDGSGDGSVTGQVTGQNPCSVREVTDGDGLTETRGENFSSLPKTSKEDNGSGAKITVDPSPTLKPLSDKQPDPSPAPVTAPVTNPSPQEKDITPPYPGRLARNQIKEPKILAAALRGINSKAEFDQLMQQYSRDRIEWVWRYELTQTERLSLTPLVKGELEQLSLFAQATQPNQSTQPKSDDTVDASFETTKESAKPALRLIQVGDKVTISYGIYQGKIGTVISKVFEDDYWFVMEFDGVQEEIHGAGYEVVED